MPQQNLGDISQQSERHDRVRAALVFEKKIEQDVPIADFNGEKQVRMNLLKAGLHEGSGQNGQRWPVDPSRDPLRQVALEKRGGVFFLGENRFEKSVMGLRCGS